MNEYQILLGVSVVIALLLLIGGFAAYGVCVILVRVIADAWFGRQPGGRR